MITVSIEQLTKRIAMLEQKVDAQAYEIECLKNANKSYGPIDPSYWVPPQKLKINTQCNLCGLELNQVMSYSCPHANCPCGMGPITC